MFKSVLVTLALIFLATLSFSSWNEVSHSKSKVIDKVTNEYLDSEKETKTQSTSVEASSVNTNSNDDSEPTLLVGPYVVSRVIDGDTIVVDVDGYKETVRMIGIDTPETVHPEKPIQCFGTEASVQTKKWLDSAYVYLEFDVTQGQRDKYGRWLAYVYRLDGLHINLELIRQGYAYEYTYYLPYRYQREFKKAESEAKATGLGLWADGVCTF